MVKVTYVVKNEPHIGHWTWIVILKRLLGSDFNLASINRLGLIVNNIVITEGVIPTLYGIAIKPLNKCLASIALSPSIICPRINAIYSKADVGIAVSSIVRDLLISKKSVIVYPRPPELERLVRVSIDISDKRPWICYSGPLIPIKGVYLIPEVARHVIKDVEEAKFLIIGEGARDLVTRYVKKYGLEDSILITGYVPRAELFEILRKCSIYIQPSLFDAFSVAVAEAMALGSVPVVSKYVGSRDLVVKVDNSLVQEHDAEKIAKKIVEVLSDREMFRELALRARYVVGEELLINKIEEQITEVIEECLK